MPNVQRQPTPAWVRKYGVRPCINAFGALNFTRLLRIEFSGAIYQVTSRGNAREDIGLDDTDRAMFLGVLAEVIRRLSGAVMPIA